MVQIKQLPKYVVISWIICNLIALPAAAIYDETPQYFSKKVQKDNINIGFFGRVNPIKDYINHKYEKIVLLNKEVNNKPATNNNYIAIETEKPLFLIYIIWFLIATLILSLLKTKSVKTNKKSVLFTIAGVMLSVSLVLLTSSYLERNKDLQNTITISLISENLNYIIDDMISNAYWDLLWINLSNIERADPYVTIRFNRAGTLSAVTDHQQLMDDYKNFIQTTYASLNKMNIELTDFYSNFTIMPFNSTYKINRTTMIFYSNDTASLNRIAITLRVDQDRANEISNSTPSNTTGIIITVNAYDANGLDLFQGSPKTASLDPSQTNLPSEVIFQSADFRVFFGAYNGDNGVLRVETNNLAANITQFDITYTSNETLAIKPDAKMNITKLDKFNKQTDVILYQG